MKTKNENLIKCRPDEPDPAPCYPIPEAERLYSLARQPDGEWGVWSHVREIQCRGAGSRRVGGYFLKATAKGDKTYAAPGVTFTIKRKVHSHLIHVLVRELVPKSEAQKQ